MESIMLVAFPTTRPLGFQASSHPPWFVPIAISKSLGCQGIAIPLHTLPQTIFRNIPLDSFVFKWQLEAAR